MHLEGRRSRERLACAGRLRRRYGVRARPQPDRARSALSAGSTLRPSAPGQAPDRHAPAQSARLSAQSLSPPSEALQGWTAASGERQQRGLARSMAAAARDMRSGGGALPTLAEDMRALLELRLRAMDRDGRRARTLDLLRRALGVESRTGAPVLDSTSAKSTLRSLRRQSCRRWKQRADRQTGRQDPLTCPAGHHQRSSICSREAVWPAALALDAMIAVARQGCLRRRVRSARRCPFGWRVHAPFIGIEH